MPLHRVGSAYAVPPGTVRNGSGGNYQVYSAFYRAWLDRGWPAPARSVRPHWLTADSAGPGGDPPLPPGLALPAVGEAAARKAWRAFLAGPIDSYPRQRDRPDLDGTSRMSVHLKWGTIHPRTLLADLAGRHEAYRKELGSTPTCCTTPRTRPGSTTVPSSRACTTPLVSPPRIG
ncbi:MAG TPA: hypothetical protein VJ851_06425 [Jatrophihabitans sp.]|nr:hypothetical protein [Jatrophihabitans sp.]